MNNTTSTPFSNSLESIIIILQVLAILLSGFIMSNQSTTFTTGNLGLFAFSFIVFISLGVLGTGVALIALFRKNRTWIVWILLITSLCLLTLKPALLLTKQVAGMLSYTHSNQRMIDDTQHRARIEELNNTTDRMMREKRP